MKILVNTNIKYFFFFSFIFMGKLFAQTSFVGVVKPIYEAKLSVATDGVVSSIKVKEGDRVRVGQTLLKIDDKLQVLETNRRKIIFDDKTELESAKKSFLILKDILEKKEKLYTEAKAVSLNNLNQLRIQYVKAKGEIESLIANEQKEHIEYKISQEVLEQYRLKSPVKGIITSIDIKKGEWVQTSNEVIKVVDPDTCYLEVDLDTNFISTLKLNSEVLIESGEGENKVMKKGVVVFISSVADISSGLIRTKIEFDNKDYKIVPGTTAKVLIP